jgi:5-bromo-4-chloroindolyl phosphate hydrolysis protein
MVARRVSSKDMKRPNLPAGLGTWPLYILPLILIPTFVFGFVSGNKLTAFTALAAHIVGWIAAGTIRKGIKAQAEFDAKKIAYAPSLPRKLLGSILIAVSFFAVSWLCSDNGIVLSLLAGGIALAVLVFAYGMDPTNDKVIDAEIARKSGIKTERVIEALREADTKISSIEASARKIKNRDLKDRLARIAFNARAVIARIEEDPRDMERSRKFLITYLEGTERVVKMYAEQQDDLPGSTLHENFGTVLTTIEDTFEEQEKRLLNNNAQELDVEIEILRTQMEREGVV